MKYLIYGKGRSGLAAAKLLESKGFEVALFDDNSPGSPTKSGMTARDYAGLVLSPGIPYLNTALKSRFQNAWHNYCSANGSIAYKCQNKEPNNYTEYFCNRLSCFMDDTSTKMCEYKGADNPGPNTIQYPNKSAYCAKGKCDFQKIGASCTENSDCITGCCSSQKCANWSTSVGNAVICGDS